MKMMKWLMIFALFLSGVMQMLAQTYNFTAPQGYGASATGGAGGTVTTVTTMTELKNALSASGKGIILVKGSIQCDYLSILIVDKTILGLPGAKLYTNIQVSKGSGIMNIKPGSNNVIIRNLIFEGPGAWDEDGRDCLTNEATNIWVDHCEFRDGMDGNFDNKGEADNVTVSWCKFTYLKAPRAGGSGGADDHRYSNLVSSSDSDFPADGMRNVTWQYCWWAPGCVERMVRARNAQLHQLNCYWNSPNTNKAIGMSAGTKGCSDYVESGVFDIPGTVADLGYGGSPKIAFVNCTGGGTNVGTVAKPTYTYEVTPVGKVVDAVTNSTCGAGATLLVSTTGVITTGACGTVVPTLTLTSGTETQTVASGTAITTMVYTWGGSATDVTYTTMPAGLTATKNATNKTLTISGTPTASGTFTVTTSGGSPAISLTGTITVTTSTPTLTNTGSLTQTVASGSAIASIVFTWGGSATDVTYTTPLPAGLTAVKNTSSKTLTLSGTPTASGTFTVTTVQASGTAAKLSSTITVTTTKPTVALKTGWNLVGCPLTGSTDVATALASIWTSVEVVKDLDSFYIKSQTGPLNSLLQLSWGKGYWVKVTKDCELTW